MKKVLKKVILVIIFIYCCIDILAQQDKVYLYSSLYDESIPIEASNILINKMNKAIIVNGMGSDSNIKRYLLSANVDIVQKNVIPTTPSRVSMKMDITFYVGDVIDNKLLESCTLSVTGIGLNEKKALNSAFQTIKPQNSELQMMLSSAKQKIVTYYTNNCNDILSKASGLAQTGMVEEAIYQLMIVPNICQECYSKCQQLAIALYQQKIDLEASQMVLRARSEWMKNPTAEGASIAANLICQINPHSNKYQEAIELSHIIESKLETDAKKEWEFKMKQYEDNLLFKRSIVDACKDIGVAFGMGQPKEITKTIIKGWF